MSGGNLSNIQRRAGKRGQARRQYWEQVLHQPETETESNEWQYSFLRQSTPELCHARSTWTAHVPPLIHGGVAKTLFSAALHPYITLGSGPVQAVRSESAKAQIAVNEWMACSRDECG